MALILINARPSPFGRKVAIALIEKELDYEVRYDVPWGNETVTPEFNPLEQLPILICENGDTINDSSYILEWLELNFPTPALLPANIEGRVEAKKRQMMGERIMEIAQSLIFETHRADPSQPWIERQTRKLHGGLAELERIYAGRNATCETPVDLGDIAVCTTLQLFEFAVQEGLSPPLDALIWRDRYPALTHAIMLLDERPSFRDTRPRPMNVDLAATVR